MSGKKILSQSPTRAEALTLQSSTYGATIPWLRGMHRVPGNLGWYGDFKATAHTTKQGGKGGGGGKSTTYTYSASLLMMLCHGTVVDIPAVWKGKSRTTLASLGLTRLGGAIGQAVWSGLTGKGNEAIGYSGLAAVAAQAYELGDSPSVENHSFEVRHSSAYSVSAGSPDVDPAAAVYDLLTDVHRGAALPAALMGDWSAWSDYCVASGLLMSPLLTTQSEAREVLQTVADLTNAAIVWSEGKVKIKPYGDAVVTGNGRTFTPDTTPVYQLDDTCFIVSDGKSPVRCALKTPADCYNTVPVEYKDRLNAYNTAVVTAKDLTDISANGVRPMDVIEAHWICEAAVARLVAEIKKQRSLLVVGEYTITLSWHYALIECMDLLTLTEAALRMQDTPVRVKSIVEESDEELTLVCEDYPAGMASAPRYAAQVPAGFATDALAVPPTVTDAVFFEAPAALAGNTGLDVWCAVSTPGGNWGGCTVWVSLDGNTYRAMARVEGSARVGTLSAPITGGQLQLQGVQGQLIGASAADAAALTTLCVVLGAQPEYLAYEAATLLGAGAYTLGGLVRGAYGSPTPTHAAGDRFVRIDDALARSGGLDVSYIGKRIHFKLTSFNLYGAAEQSLADVEAMDYDVTGVFAKAAPGTAGRGITLKASSVTAKQDGAGVRAPAAITLTAEVKGSLQGVPTWSVVAGAATLSGAGLQRSVATSSITAPARIRVELTDEVGTYADEVTINVVSDGSAGADGQKYAQAVLYQWAPVQPSAPNGQSTWTWATATQSAYTGGNSWQIGIPANPGGSGLRLWSGTQQLSAAGGVATTTVAWSAGAAIAAVGANGLGTQNAEAAVFAWALNLASLPPLIGTATYTWATSSLSAAPAGWALSPGTSATAGQTLFKGIVRLQEATTAPTTTVDFTLASTSAVGYAGTAGGPGSAGASARIAYAKVSGATIGAGAVTTAGATSFPPVNSWGRGETWSGSVPTFGADESVMQTNGVYDPATGNTVWGSPYLSSWRVGKLSAITADIGDITGGSLNIGGGRFTVSAWGYMSARGGELLDDAGNVILRTRSGALSPLPAAWVNAAAGWLNSNVAIPYGIMNADPGLLDAANAWTWDSAITIQGPSTAPGALGVKYFSSNAFLSGNQYVFSNGQYPISASRTYNLSALLYASVGNDRNMYLVVDMFKADGTRLTGVDTGWGGTYAGYAFGGGPTPGQFTRYGSDFGAGTAFPHSPDRRVFQNLRLVSVWGVWLKFGAAGSGGHSAHRCDRGDCRTSCSICGTGHGQHRQHQRFQRVGDSCHHAQQRLSGRRREARSHQGMERHRWRKRGDRRAGQRVRAELQQLVRLHRLHRWLQQPGRLPGQPVAFVGRHVDRHAHNACGRRGQVDGLL